jgi:hypothetical protein
LVRGIVVNRIIIQGTCAIVYDFDHPFDKARVWIETYDEPIFVGEKLTYGEIQERRAI